MAYKILLYETGTAQPVGKFIKTLDAHSYAKILHVFSLLKRYGSNLGMPHVKKIKNKLLELRIRGKEEVRLIFVQNGQKIHVLNAFKKKTNKIPRKEISLAEKRLAQI